MRILRTRERSLGAAHNSTLSDYPVAAAVTSAIGVMAAVAFVNWRLSEKPSAIIRRKVSFWRSMAFAFTMWSGARADRLYCFTGTEA